MKVSTEIELREKLSCAAFCYSMDANVNSNSFSNLQFRFLTNFLLRVYFQCFCLFNFNNSFMFCICYFKNKFIYIQTSFLLESTRN